MKKNKITAYYLIFIFSSLIISNSHSVTIIINQDCGLADAIIAANTDQTVGFCPAGNGADELIFELENQTLNVSNGVFTSALGGMSKLAFPTITTEISIDGKGVAIRADTSQNFYRIFDVKLCLFHRQNKLR